MNKFIFFKDILVNPGQFNNATIITTKNRIEKEELQVSYLNIFGFPLNSTLFKIALCVLYSVFHPLIIFLYYNY